jgi:hypothetical protein
MNKKTLLTWLLIPLSVVSLTACNFPVSSEPTATLEPTLALVPTNPIPVATVTSLPTNPIPPPTTQSTQVPPTRTTALPAPQATRLSFPTGATNVDVQGNVAQGETTSYLVNAVAKQYMMVMLSSANQALVLQIQSPDGAKLASASQKLTYWQGTLPLSGDYLISVVSKGGAGNFNLNITIPVRVSFATGAVSATMNGLVGPQQINTYLLRALQGQTMTVTINSPQNNIFLTIYGLEDGNPYVRSAMGLFTYTFKLPATQDYVIQCVSTSNAAENYTVTFTVI